MTRKQPTIKTNKIKSTRKSISSDSQSNCSNINNISISINNIGAFDENQTSQGIPKTGRSSLISQSFSRDENLKDANNAIKSSNSSPKVSHLKIKRRPSLRKMRQSVKQPSLSTILSPVHK